MYFTLLFLLLSLLLLLDTETHEEDISLNCHAFTHLHSVKYLSKNTSWDKTTTI